MSSPQKRATVYFDPDVHRALRLKAAATDRSISDIVDEAVRLSLAEDADNLLVHEERLTDPIIGFDDLVKDLKRRGAL